MLSKEQIEKATKILIDNGVDYDEADIVLQALCYVLLDIDILEE